MKKHTLTIALLFIFKILSAAPLVDGYVILTNGDTINCKIKITRHLDLFDRISVTDSLQKKTTYIANKKEIIGFGFVYKNQPYHYVLKTDDKNETLFFLIKALGPRLNLFYRFYYNDTGSGASYRSDVFMLEYPDKKIVSVYGGLFSGWNKKIKNFLSADPTLLSLFEKKVSSITDIPEFVKAANSLQK